MKITARHMTRPATFFGAIQNSVSEKIIARFWIKCEEIRTKVLLLTKNVLSDKLQEFYDYLGYNGKRFCLLFGSRWFETGVVMVVVCVLINVKYSLREDSPITMRSTEVMCGFDFIIKH